MNTKIYFIVGTRPEALKMLPVIKRVTSPFEVIITGQHDESMLGSDFWDFVENRAFRILSRNRTPSEPSGVDRLMERLRLLELSRRDHVIVQGDTNSAVAGGLVGAYAGAVVHHVEAGLRTFDSNHPFPEELNRRVLAAIATWHYAPTSTSEQNLLNEGVHPENVYVTGNTSIDALLEMLQVAALKGNPGHRPAEVSRLLVVTSHRREAHGELRRLLYRNLGDCANMLGNDWKVVVLTHPNPAILSDVAWALDNVPKFNSFDIVEPLGHSDFIRLLQRSELVLSDSGGIQEEAPTLGLRVLVAREHTERPEAIRDGGHILVGADGRHLEGALRTILTDSDLRFRGPNPFGDGLSGKRIADHIHNAVRDGGRLA